MSKFLNDAKIRIIIMPLLGAAGAVFAMLVPWGYKAFCNGLPGIIA